MFSSPSSGLLSLSGDTKPALAILATAFTLLAGIVVFGPAGSGVTWNRTARAEAMREALLGKLDSPDVLRLKPIDMSAFARRRFGRSVAAAFYLQTHTEERLACLSFIDRDFHWPLPYFIRMGIGRIDSAIPAWDATPSGSPVGFSYLCHLKAARSRH